MKTTYFILFVIVLVNANGQQNLSKDSNTVSALLKAVSTFEGPDAPTIRSNAATRLALRGDIKILIPLATNDPDPCVRNAAVTGMTFNSDPSVTLALIQALKDTDPQVRENAALGLGLTAREIMPGEMAALAKCLEDEDLTVLRQAAGILYMQPGGTDLAMPELQELLKSRKANLKNAATEALKKNNAEDALGIFLQTLAISISEEQGNKWTATLKIVDEAGNPIQGADISVTYWLPPLPYEDQYSNMQKIEGPTDNRGIFIASHKDSSWELGFNAQKDAYYSANAGHEFIKFAGNDPSKWNPHVTLVLKKKIGQPIPMYARWIESEPPAFGKTGRPPIDFDRSIGYDLVAGDWVAPSGKGAHSNIIFREKFDKKSITDFYYKVVVSFPGAGDGIQEYTVSDVEKENRLRSPHEAPLDGYQAQIAKENYPGKPYDFDENRTYLFRVTLPDGPHYGKIYGDFMRFCYYLNPTPNDRVIEFDPHHNLFKLKRYDLSVTAP